MIAKPISEWLTAKEAGRLTPELSGKMQSKVSEEVKQEGT